MFEAFGLYGPNMKSPSYHELRVLILEKEVEYIKNLLKNHNDAWMDEVWSFYRLMDK